MNKRISIGLILITLGILNTIFWIFVLYLGSVIGDCNPCPSFYSNFSLALQNRGFDIIFGSGFFSISLGIYLAFISSEKEKISTKERRATKEIRESNQ